MHTGGIRYREYPVHAALAPFVKCIWSLESDQPVYDAPRERILPDGCVELVVHFHDPFRSHFANGASNLQPRSFVAGQMRNFLEIEPAGRMGLIATRFRARGAYRFFPTPLSAVAAALVDLEEVWGKRARDWMEQITLAGGMAARVRIVEKALLDALREKDRADRAVDRCLHLIEAAAGQVRVAQLAPALGLCSRQLTRRFENAVGVSPKEFARVSRFLNGVRRLRASRPGTLTETALECGYFDQAHFNHEFREFSGMTPGEFLVSPNVVF
jgi:AraC-like DNA-binding protein